SPPADDDVPAPEVVVLQHGRKPRKPGDEARRHLRIPGDDVLLEPPTLFEERVGRRRGRPRDLDRPGRYLVERPQLLVARATLLEQIRQPGAGGGGLERARQLVRLEAAEEARRVCRDGTPRLRREPKATLVALERCGIAADARELQHPSRLARAGPEQLEDRARE